MSSFSVATVFGRGDRVSNFIAIDDVVSFVLAVLRDTGVKNQVIEIGGPSQVTLVQFAASIQRAMGVPEKRRHVPAPVLNVAIAVLRQAEPRQPRYFVVLATYSLDENTMRGE